MQARYIRSLFFLLFLNLLVKPFWLLGIERTVQNVAGTANFGLYAALQGLSLYLLILLDPGLHTYNNKTIAGEPEKLTEYLSAFIPMKLMLSLGYILFTMLAGWLLGYEVNALRLLFLLTLYQVLSSFLLYMRTNLSGLHLFNTDSIFSVLDRLLMILICGAILLSSAYTISILDFVYAQLAASAIAVFFAFVVVLRHAGKLHFRIDWKFLAGILKQSYPFALLAIFMILYSRIDTLMLERMLPDGKTQAGIYAMGYRLLEAANMIALLFSTILLPLLSGMLHRKESVAGVVNTFARMLLVPALVLVVASWFYRREIIYLLYTEATPMAAEAFGWLMAGFMATSAIYIYGTLLTANSNLRFLNTIAVIGLAANIGLNAFLIPAHKALGAAIATLATQGFVAVAHYVSSQKRFSLHVHSMEAGRIGLFIAVVISGFYFMRGILENWFLNMILLIAISLTFAVILGLLKLKYFSNLLKLRS